MTLAVIAQDFSGAFSTYDTSWAYPSYVGGNCSHINFNASKSNSIYGNSNHVTPINMTYKIWKRTL